MTEPVYDLVIRGGRVATASDVFEADVAISGETIAAIGRGMQPGRREIDARGKLVLPGGVDSHAHIEQLSAAGIINADSFESATVSAAFGDEFCGQPWSNFATPIPQHFGGTLARNDAREPARPAPRHLITPHSTQEEP